MNDRYVLSDATAGSPARRTVAIMTERIGLVADGRADARRAVSFAIRMADRAGATLHAVYVTQPDTIVGRLAPGENPRSDRTEARPSDAFLSMVRDAAAGTAVRCETAVCTGKLDRVVAEYVRAEHIDHLVLGRAPRQGLLDRIAAGSRERLVRRVDVPITFVGTPALEPAPESLTEASVESPTLTID